jgi:hypothetical protein
MKKPSRTRFHAIELAKLCGDLDLDTHSYTEYHQTMHHRLWKLHETVASSFDEVKTQCLPLPDKGMKIEEMIDWVAREVKVVPDTVLWLNDRHPGHRWRSRHVKWRGMSGVGSAS